jgi:DNA-binding SARP family transcriptional activator
MTTFHLTTLGATSLAAAHGQPLPLPHGKPLALLVHLALQRSEYGEEASRDAVATLLWPDAPTDRARHSLRQALVQLRKLLGDDVLAPGEPLRLRPGVVATDLAKLETALESGDLDRAIELWRGTFLVGLSLPDAPAWSRWVEETRSALEHRFASALVEGARRSRVAGEPRRAVGYLRRAVDVQPQHAPAWAELIETLLDGADSAAAAAALAEARLALEGVENDLETLGRRIETLRERRGDSPPAGTLSLPFTGRDRELAELVGMWRRAAADGMQLALVRGPAGIGKSRLAREVSHVADQTGAVTLAKAYEAESRLEYALLAEVVRGLVRCRGAAGVSRASEQVLRTLLPDVATSVTAESAHAAPHPVLLAAAMADLISAVADEQPLLVVVEDVQWADPLSASVLHRVLREVRQSPAMLVLTARLDSGSTSSVPESLRILADAGGRVVPLAPLGLEDVRDLCARLLDEPPEKVDGAAERLHRVSGGNPLFLVEILKSLHESGVLEHSDGRWRLDVGRLPAEMPAAPTLEETIDHRLERLTGEADVLAASLALQPRASDAAELRRAAGLSENSFSRALQELFAREVLRWTADQQIDFAHDQMRAAVLRRSTAALRPWWTTGRQRLLSRGGLAAAAVLVLVVAGSLAALVRGSKPGAGAPLYGGGTLVVQVADSVIAFRPPAGRADPWVPMTWPGGSPRHPVLLGPYRTLEGGMRWFAQVYRVHEAPYGVELLPGGQPRILLPPDDRLDAGVLGLGPDGRAFLYWFQNPESPTYARDLFLVADVGAEPRLLYRAQQTFFLPEWSPDGRAIALPVDAAVDTVLVLTPLGRRIATWAFPEVSSVSWCGGSEILVAAVREGDDRRLVRLHLGRDSVERVPSLELVSDVTCSPDGSAVAYRAIREGRLVTVVQDLGDGSVRVLPVDERRSQSVVRWVPDRLLPVPVAVRIENAPSSLAWGSQTRFNARVRYTGGRSEDAEVDWSSSDPSVVSVQTGGVAFGNRPGEAWVFATAGGWRRDSVRVAVTGQPAGEVLLQDRFERLDTAVWLLIGEPTPQPIRVDGEPVLDLRGDGMYRDGILARRPINLARGATLELGFRISRLDRVDRQRIGVCLEDVSLPSGADPRNPTYWTHRGGACVWYPARELLDFSRSEIGISIGPAARYVDLAGTLPAPGWTHLALQVRADGLVSVFVNRRFVAHAPLRLDMDPSAEWRVALFDAALDTQVQVRNLVVWPEPRYEVP